MTKLDTAASRGIRLSGSLSGVISSYGLAAVDPQPVHNPSARPRCRFQTGKSIKQLWDFIKPTKLLDIHMEEKKNQITDQGFSRIGKERWQMQS